ncbi:MAG: hypothetical protein CM1200mP9_02410 [Gammaproteobacteria bacterium]|nr:MAG: hypothetical protein CM1200mP9_02410 [Gammaproteobacteria bacterium]
MTPEVFKGKKGKAEWEHLRNGPGKLTEEEIQRSKRLRPPSYENIENEEVLLGTQRLQNRHSIPGSRTMSIPLNKRDMQLSPFQQNKGHCSGGCLRHSNGCGLRLADGTDTEKSGLVMNKISFFRVFDSLIF